MANTIFSQNENKFVGKPIIANKLARKPMFFELDINDPPPVLTLLINPAEFTRNFQKRVVQSRTRPTTRDRGAYNLQYYFDELDVMTCSGTSAMFMGENGLTSTFRTDTLAFQNLKSLIEIYRNNGRNYNSRPINGQPLVTTGGTGLIESVGRVIIAYDGIVYRGAFDSFTVDETDEKPYSLAFNFQFTVSDTIDIRSNT